ncbi:hypothetical protein Pan97_39530 [Bremerella volcania]|uniref:Uncharacterized protein n=1 Tax=Bremerella volcania TaxID=2527984 RepID=A0A518CCE0_9BACT|nr:hypothetical protein [Bremerella volcania]QDU76896.1 hypothetical protein Pan97_39530 [Bremerella volcania]
MRTKSTPCAEDARRQDPDTKEKLPEEVADAWAAVLIDIYEKRRKQAEANDGDAAA